MGYTRRRGGMKKISGIVGYIVAWATLALLVAMGIAGFFLILQAVVRILSR